jgi:hypothetical protein
MPRQHFESVGNLAASPEILAQMADRCYLENTYDRLYTEFVLGGIAKKRDAQGNEQVIFASPQDMAIKMPGFYLSAKKRMDDPVIPRFNSA